MSFTRNIIASLALFGLAACASGSSRPSKATLTANEAALRSAGTIGDPGKVAAADIAFARAARTEGQWTAFREFAAANALIHGDAGAIEAGSWLSGRSDPAQAVQWAPRAVFASCDGTLAVSTGRFAEPGGLVGTYVTVWAPERSGEYKWIYDMGAPDDPQPAPPPADDIPQGEDVILVEALDAIEGKVADCARRNGEEGGERPPAPPQAMVPGDNGGTSRDGTMRWSWEQRADGSRRVIVRYLRDGAWQVPVDFEATPRGG